MIKYHTSIDNTVTLTKILTDFLKCQCYKESQKLSKSKKKKKKEKEKEKDFLS